MNGLIYDKEKIYEFYNNIIKDIELNGDKALILFLTSRGKYYNEPLKQFIKSDNFLNRYLHKYNDPNLFLQSIKKLNLDNESYFIKLKLTKDEWEKLDEETKMKIINMVGQVYFIPAVDKNKNIRNFAHIHPLQETMTIYIDLNPKSTLKGALMLNNLIMKQLGELALLNIENSETEQILKWFKRLHTNWLAEVHKSNAEKKYFLIDIDVKDNEILEWVISTIGEEPKLIVHTRNGYHLIYQDKRKLKKTAYLNMLEKAPQTVEKMLGFWDSRIIEVKNQVLVPIPGTRQAGFKVKAEYF